MNGRPQRGGRAALLPLGCLVFLPLLAVAGTWFFGSRGLPSLHTPSTLASSGWGVLPGMGATLLPRWNLGNFDPRLEGASPGEERPVPGGIPCAPDRGTTLTRFPRGGAGEPWPQLQTVARREVPQ